ncbi:alpha/beta hydrolase fold domain-containing protein [Microbacterium sp. YY-03]|uniref:alpha/beta hydrolase fold domain-containing protein n=1 Tax=Microbacterium sp. YY-03 TaxID=3421636 RepID=UPI003D16AA33
MVNPHVSIRLFRPKQLKDTKLPVLLWIHGGGHLTGAPEQDDRANMIFARELGIVVAAVRYRIGALASAPASVTDCYAALRFLYEGAPELGLDPDRFAVGGASAGGGIAAGLVLFNHDHGVVPLTFQLLVYPMLDDRTVSAPRESFRMFHMWSPASNRLGWSTYLATTAGSAEISPYAVPARREDLTGLPPAWIGVGTLDLFLEENIEYARRLRDAGVACEVDIVSGAFHGFDQVFFSKGVSRTFRASQMQALRQAGIQTVV